jgi:hypothetical protein
MWRNREFLPDKMTEGVTNSTSEKCVCSYVVEVNRNHGMTRVRTSMKLPRPLHPLPVDIHQIYTIVCGLLFLCVP